MEVPVNANIITGEGASVELQPQGQLPIEIGESRSIVLSPEVAQNNVDPATNATTPIDPEAAAILTALDAGVDPFLELDPTAAVVQAGTDGDGGSSFTRLISIIETTNPLAIEYPRPALPRPEEERLSGVRGNAAPELTIGLLELQALLDQLNDDSDFIAGINVGQYFTDPDGDSLTFSATGLPPGLTIDPNTGIISGTIDKSASQGGPNNDGIYNVVITANDGRGGSVDLPFKWTTLNPPPVALDDAATTEENTIVEGSVIDGYYTDNDGNRQEAGPDHDPDGDDIFVVGVSSETNPSDVNNWTAVTGGGTVIVGTNENGEKGGGTFILYPDGSYSFNPGTDFDYLKDGEKTTTTISYQISDGEGGFDTAKLVITVTGTNDAPIIAPAGSVLLLNDGTKLPDVPGATTTVNVGVVVTAVTDPIKLDLKENLDNSQITFNEDTPFDLAALLEVSFPDDCQSDSDIENGTNRLGDGNSTLDMDGSEERWFEITGLPEGSVIVSGDETYEADGNGVIKVPAPGLSTDANAMPEMKIVPPKDFSGTVAGIKVSFVAEDRDVNGSSEDGQEERSTIEDLTLHINPVAGDFEISDVTVQEDSSIAFLAGLKVTDDNSDVPENSGLGEEITEIIVQGIPESWTLKYLNADGTADLTMTNGYIYNENIANFDKLTDALTSNEDDGFALNVDGKFNLKENWSNQDGKPLGNDENTDSKDGGTEETYALLNPELLGGNSVDKPGLTTDAYFTYEDSNGEVVTVYYTSTNPNDSKDTGFKGGFLIPMEFLDTVVFYPPKDLAGEKHEFNAIVNPSPESTMNSDTIIDEDTLDKVDFGIANNGGDENESLTAVYIKIDDVEGKEFTLYLGENYLTLADAAETPGSGVTSDGEFYRIDVDNVDNIFVKADANFAHNNGESFDFSVKYEITDESSDGKVDPVTEITEETKHKITVKPITDPVELQDFAAVGIDNHDGFYVDFTVAKKPDANAGDEADTDGSEQFTQVVITGVPVGMVVSGITLGSGEDATILDDRNVVFLGDNKWLINIPASEASKFEGDITGSLQFKSGNFLKNGDHELGVTVVTQDTGAENIATDNKGLTINSNIEGSGEGDLLDDVSTTIIPLEFTTGTEDESFKLSEVIEVTINNMGEADAELETHYSVIVKLPEGAQIFDGDPDNPENEITSTLIDGEEVWVISGKGNQSDLESLLENLTVIPPKDWNDNQGKLPLDVTVTTHLDNGSQNTNDGLSGDNSLDVSLTPVTDGAVVDIEFSAANENGEPTGDKPHDGSDVVISLTVRDDADSNAEFGDNVYIQITESNGLQNANGLQNGTLFDSQGNELTKVTIADGEIAGLPAGDYYVATLPDGKTNVDVRYEPSDTAEDNNRYTAGKLDITAWVQSKEHGADNWEMIEIDGVLTENPDYGKVTDTAVLEKYLSLDQDADGNAVINIISKGESGNGAVDQKIVLDGVSLSDFAGIDSNQSDMIKYLIDNGKIHVDQNS